jgi:Na+-driven multidrug efflux pump
MPEPADGVTYRQLVRFFLPMGATPFLIASTRSLMNAALARLPLPELNLAAFRVVESLTNTVTPLDTSVREAVVSLVDDPRSFRMVMKFVWSLCGLFLVILLLLGFTSAGSWVLRNGMGLSEPRHIALAYMAMRITCFLPIVVTFRSGAHGLAIGLDKTRILPVGTVIRFIAVFLFLWWAVRTQGVLGVIAASLAWTVGIGIEGLLVVGYLVRCFGSLNRSAEWMPHRNERNLTIVDITKFSAPLVVMALLTQSLQPVLQSGLARSTSPTRSLAAYGVAWGVVLITISPIRFLRQCSLMYTKEMDDPNWKTVKRFCLAVGLMAAGLILTMAATPIGYWFLRRIIGVPEPVAQMALPTLGVFALFPLMRAWREAYWGILIRQRSTSIIGGAKVANLAVVGGIILLVFGSLHAGLSIPPSAVGALVYTFGEGLESVIIWRHAVNRVRGSLEITAQG